MTQILSKSKLLAFRQCPKRLWLEVHRPGLSEDSPSTQARFKVGHEVGDIARRLYDADDQGTLIDIKAEGFAPALARTRALLESRKPIFEAGFSAAGALAFADIMLPVHKHGQPHWRMVEIKSSTEVKDYHRDDAAVQAFVARSAGVPLAGIALAHIDNTWVYPGGGDYTGLLKEQDLTAKAFARGDEVQGWIRDAQAVLRNVEPDIRTGAQCSRPYACGFIGYCTSQQPQAQYPIHWLPNVRTKALKNFIGDSGAIDMRNVPDELRNTAQKRVKKHSLSGQIYFDAGKANADLAGTGLPAYFMDFETINLAVPIWQGTRAYQQIPFQFSVHGVALDGTLSQEIFLDLSGNDPSKSFAERLVAACGDQGPVFVYNAGFERGCIRGLAERVPGLEKPLLAINERLVDLQVIAAQRYYHPRQQGSWSIKQVLPAIAPDLDYAKLDGVRDGTMAMDAFREAIHPNTSPARKAQIEGQLLEYCGLDTLAMVRIWEMFTGRAGFNA